jgi:hypothetical protein
VLGQLWQLGQIAHTELSEAQKLQILSGNMAGVLGL